MRIGMMNNPARDPLHEIQWAAENGFDFIDLTLEYPKTGADVVESAAIRAMLDETGVGVVGHTAWYLPFASPVPRLREAAVAEVESAFPHFMAAGAILVNVHPDPGRRTVGIGVEQIREWNVVAFARLAASAQAHGLRLMIENIPEHFATVADLCTLLDAHLTIGFHLDIAHAQVRGNRTHEFLTAFTERLVHIHLSDNSGRSDDHLPLGTGRLDWKRLVRALKRTGYDGTITLEVFSDDRDYLLTSQRKLRAIWDQAD
ncbi:MAG: sugar phosphate isomerase/epimerase [Chloroflexota bacterium]|nr:sugar phosphate isomerase/epimerase [Chloroflexota bacterium]